MNGSASEGEIQGVAVLPSRYTELGTNGLVTARFLFGGWWSSEYWTGTLGAHTSLTIQAFNSKGKLVFTKVYVGVSKSNTGVVAEVYDPAKYEPVVMESVKIAVDRFAADLAAR